MLVLLPNTRSSNALSNAADNLMARLNHPNASHTCIYGSIIHVHPVDGQIMI